MDPERAGFEIEVPPGQTQDLALEQATAESDEIEGFPAFAADRSEKDPRFVRIERTDLPAGDPGGRARRATLRPTSSLRSA